MPKTIEDYIEEIAELPEPLNFLLESDNEQWLFDKCRKTNKILSLWLRHKILAEPLNPLALENNGHALIPQADFLKAILDLCIEIHSRIPYIESPAGLWFFFIKGKANHAVDVFGLTGKPVLRGKVDLIKSYTKLCDSFGELSVRFGDIKEPNNLEMKLYYIGQEIARRDPHFDKRTWKPFIKAWKHYLKHFRDSKHLQIPYLLPNGSLHLSKGRGRMPKIRESKRL